MQEKQKLNNIINSLLARASKVFTKKTLKLFSSTALLLSVITMAQKQAQAIVIYQLGYEDNFSQLDGPEELTYISPDEKVWFRSIFNGQCDSSYGWTQRCQLRKFDETNFNKNFLHSFDLSKDLEGKEITSATFESQIRVLHFNDTISFGHIKQPGKRYGVNALSYFGASLGQNIDVNIDLGNITTYDGSNLLSEMNKEKNLLVGIQDDTMVDYIKLTIETKSIDQSSIPEPSLILGIVSASAVTVLSQRKEK